MDDFEDELTNTKSNNTGSSGGGGVTSSTTTTTTPAFKFKKQKRCLPWNTDVLKDRFTPQIYQIELVKLALNTNLLIFIRSDEYKNYIKIMLIKQYEQIITNLRQENKKKIFILVNYQLNITKYYDLVKQHTNLKLNNLNNLNLIQLLNDIDIVKNKILHENQIFIINIQLFNEWLKRSYITLSDILLIIFDDVHNMFYNLSNKLIYEQIMSNLTKKIHIIGFGTLILDNKTSIKSLDENFEYLKTLFKCNLEIASDLLDTQNMLNGIEHRECIEICDSDDYNLDEFNVKLIKMLNETLDYLNDVNIGQYKEEIKDSQQQLSSSDIDCIYIICVKCINECIYLLKSVGIWCFTKSLLPIICQLDKLSNYLKSNNNTSQNIYYFEILLLQYISSRLRLLRELCIKQIISLKHTHSQHNHHHYHYHRYNRYQQSANASQISLIDALINKFCTSKVITLINLLRSYKDQTDSALLNQQFCCLIYVKNKQVATTLSLLLKKLSKEDYKLSYLSPNYVINSNSGGSLAATMSLDDTDTSISTHQQQHQQQQINNNNDYLKQEEIIRKFHSGEINLLVCTYDMEEYIDVPQLCNLIIRFDCDYFNYYSYILTKTRLKSFKKQTKIAYICELDKFKPFLQKYKLCKQLESLFQAKYSILIKKLSVFNEHKDNISKTDNVNVEKHVYHPTDTTKQATINLNNSIELLNRYCIRLPSDALTQLTPNYKISYDFSTKKFICKLYLPINSCLRSLEFQSDWCNTIIDAYKHVAYNVCVKLYELNELNHNLEPITKEFFYKQQFNKLFSIKDEEFLNENEDDEQQQPINFNQGSKKQSESSKFIRFKNNTNTKQTPSSTQLSMSHRPGGSKRKQMYKKKISTYLTQSTFDTQHQTYLYVFKFTLTTPLQYNSSSYQLLKPYDPNQKCFALITQKRLIEIPDYTIFTQYGEETIELIELVKENFYLTQNQIKIIKQFHKFLFTNVLRMERTPIQYQPDSNGAFICLVSVTLTKSKAFSYDIDWNIMRTVENYNDKNLFVSNETTTTTNENDEYVFNESLYQDSVVIPYYRLNDYQPQFYCVQSIDYNMNPLSKFPSNNLLYQTFYDYFLVKYQKQIQNLNQPLLIVQHPSTRLNLLTPRYMNLKATVLQKSVFNTHNQDKGGVTPATTTTTTTSSKSNSSNKIYLVPELVNTHPFTCTLWKRSLCLPSILYRLNSLLLCEELRREIASATNVGVPWIDTNFKFEKLEFIWDTKKEIEVSNVPDLEVDINSKQSMRTGDSSTGVNSGWDFEISEWDASCMTTNQFNSNGNSNKNGWFEQGDNKTLFIDINNLDMFEDEDDDDILSQYSYNNKYDDDRGSKSGKNTHFKHDFDDFDDDFNETTTIFEQKMNNNEFLNQQDKEFIINLNNLKADLKRKSAKLLSKLNINNTDLKSYMNNSSTKSRKQDQHQQQDQQEFDCDQSDDNLIKFFNETQLMYLKLNNKKQESINAVRVAIADAETLNSDDSLNVDINVFDSKYGGDSVWLNSIDVKFNQTRLTSQDTLDKYNKLIDYMNQLKSKYACNAQQKQQTRVNDESFDELFNYEDNFANKLNEYFKFNEDKGDDDECVGGIINQINHKFNFSLDYNHEDDSDDNDEYSDDDDEEFEDICVTSNKLDKAGPGPSLLLQALTLTNASDGFNLERLETIGDSFLKQAITVYLYSTYTNINEGKLSYLRSKQVSNFNLYKLGKRRCLPELIHANKFEPLDTWLPLHYDVNHANSLTFEQIIAAAFQKVSLKNQPKTPVTPAAPQATSVSKPQASQQQQFDKYKMHMLSDKSIADSVEAIIGAYLIKSGPKAALRVMHWFGLQVLPKVKLEDGSEVHIDHAIASKPQINNYKKLNYLLTGYENFENIIGYKFKTRAYLLQAFTHSSYVYNDITDCYQRLEFLGDAILDYCITRHLYEDEKKHSPGELTDLRSALVNNNIFSYLAVKYEFYKYFKYLSPQLFLIIDNFIKNYKKYNTGANANNSDVDNLDEHFLFNYYSDDEDDDNVSDYDYECHQNGATTATDNDEANNEFEELEVPKVLGDIFESVAGAIFLDSNKSLDTVWKVYYNLMKPYIEKYTNKVPKSPIRELLELEPETAKFEKPERTINGKIRVTVSVYGKGKFKGIGRNYRIAKNAAAKLALKYIRRQD